MLLLAFSAYIINRDLSKVKTGMCCQKKNSRKNLTPPSNPTLPASSVFEQLLTILTILFKNLALLTKSM